MGVRRFLMLLILVCSLAASPLAAVAQDSAPASASDAAQAPARTGVEAPDTALGALAAIGCGIMVRATLVTAGTQVGTIAGAIACCGYMLFDALVLEQN